jgi:uncharacterized protein
MNRLGREKSPYLLQHARNPVDWYPWGEEAFAKARKEDKPILLSIGYSTCHWCHVMERESFENEEIARLMNEHFVCIKLDREERPDVDKIYMTAVQALTGQGGWPLNAFLTPELKPFFGGTYFPPAARWGHPGWPQLLLRIAELWKTQRPAIMADSVKLAEALAAYGAGPNEQAGEVPAEAFDAALEALRSRYDEARGGFGDQPKFPMPVNLNFLIRHPSPEARRMTLETLRAMARGGIYDHVGGGFHRYSTDGDWRVPHFEKMLYDNAQLAINYLEAFQLTGEEDFARIARETLDYVLRDMTSPEGAFYSAEDADSEGKEGFFYLWTEAEIRELLGARADAFIAAYGVEKNGNAPVDPHGDFTGRNILYAKKPAGLAKEREALRVARAKRPHPHLDDKILVSWNGLMISALAKAAGALGEPRYLAAAEKAAAFTQAKLVAKGRLLRRWRDGEAKGPAVSDDYAFLAQGLIDLYEAGGKPEWLDWAVSLHETLLKLYGGPNGGLYLTAEGDDPNLITRVMEDSDNVEPCASSVAALNGLRLAQLRDREDLRESAEKTLRLFAPLMLERSLALPQMLVAADFARGPVKQTVIAAETLTSPGVAELRAEIAKRFLPKHVLVYATKGAVPPWLKDAKIGPKATAYACVDFACTLPTDDPKKLAATLGH